VSRFLFALPERRVGYRPFRPHPIAAAALETYETAVNRLRTLPTPPLAAPEGAGAWRVLQLTGEALELWSAFYDATDAAMRPGGRLAGVTDWGGKLPGNVARIAALFHAVEAGPEPCRQPIASEAVAAAVRIGEALQHHALAAYQLLGADPATAPALRTWEAIVRHRWPRFTRRDLYRALGEAPKALDPAVEVLLDCGYLRPLPPPPRPESARGRPAPPTTRSTPRPSHLLQPRDRNDRIDGNRGGDHHKGVDRLSVVRRVLTAGGQEAMMTITLDLPHDLEERLASEAAQEGLPLEQYALRLLGQGSSAEGRPRNGAELVAYWRREGVIGSRPDIEDSQTYARALRERAERRLGG
jgi:Protein of unknown function (DUF3987)